MMKRNVETIVSIDTEELRQAYLRDLLAAQRTSAHELIMDAFHKGYPIPDIYMDVFQASLYEIGHLWESNRISVADEHLSTIITQFIMSDLYQHLEIAEARQGKLVMTGVQGELHQVGANMVSDVLEADGWDVMFLGADVPPDEVIRAIRVHGANLLGVSVTMYDNIPKLIQLVDMVRREFGEQAPRVMVGGGAFAMNPELPPELAGCLVARNLREALELTRRQYLQRSQQP